MDVIVLAMKCCSVGGNSQRAPDAVTKGRRSIDGRNLGRSVDWKVEFMVDKRFVRGLGHEPEEARVGTRTQ